MALISKLKELCYVRQGTGSTKGHTIVIVKNMKDENLEAADLLVRSLYGEVIQSSRGTYMVKA